MRTLSRALANASSIDVGEEVGERKRGEEAERGFFKPVCQR